MLTNKLMERWIKRTELGGDRVFIWSGGMERWRKEEVAAITAAIIKQKKKSDIYVGCNKRSELHR